MNFETIPTRLLTPYAGNARIHSPRQIRQIGASIKKFGFNNPVLVNDDNQIIAGHGRVEAAKFLELKTVPAVRLSHLSEIETRAYILADNRLAEKAGWDNEMLAIELQGLVDLGFAVLETLSSTAQLALRPEMPTPLAAVANATRHDGRTGRRRPQPPSFWQSK